MGYGEVEVTLRLTYDELDIIYNAIKEIEATQYYGLGFDITITSLLEKIESAREGW